jgi:hypothetical protein
MNEARVQQAMEQAQMGAHIANGVFGENLPSAQWTVTLPYPDWERLIIEVLHPELREVGSG